MKRRSFLSFLGAATVAPALPALGAAAPSQAAVSLATAHARRYPYISVIGLSRRIGVSEVEAKGLMHELSRQGILGPLRNSGPRPIFAGSKVFTPAEGSLIKAAQEQRAKHAAQQETQWEQQRRINAQKRMRTDLTAMLTHLRDMADGYFTRGLA